METLEERFALVEISKEIFDKVSLKFKEETKPIKEKLNTL